MPVLQFRDSSKAIKFGGVHLAGTQSRAQLFQFNLVRSVGGGNLTKWNRKQNSQRETSSGDSRRSVHSRDANTILNRVENSTRSDRKTSNVSARDLFYFHFLSLAAFNYRKRFNSLVFVCFFFLFSHKIFR